MGLKDDLTAQVNETFQTTWDEQETKEVPEPIGLRLDKNHAKNLEAATVLYADLDGSTQMVEDYSWEFSAEVYKTYLKCAAQIIKSEGGIITAYDGDRIMSIFTGNYKNTSAVRSALKINYAVIHIIQPALEVQYQSSEFTLKHVVGIDTSELRASRIGVRGDNDIVWIGRAANYAAKLTSLSGSTTWITESVYEKMNKEVKFSEGNNMWSRDIWKEMDNLPIYASDYWWEIV
jgi:class 3 adenylate cyclase